MKLFKISQELNDDYDTYDSAVVCADNEAEARKIHPSSFVTHVTEGKWMGTYVLCGESTGKEYDMGDDGTWVRYDQIHLITVELIGEAKKGMKKGVVIASFNAG